MRRGADGSVKLLKAKTTRQLSFKFLDTRLDGLKRREGDQSVNTFYAGVEHKWKDHKRLVESR